MPITPRDNGQQLDSFNQQMRSSPVWQDFMRRLGYDLSRPTPIRLSDQQRKQLQATLSRSGVQFDRGMEIDPAGNVNQNQQPGKKIAIGAAIGGAALTGLGAAGIGPMAGLLGGGAAAGGAGAAGAGGTLASSSLPVAGLMGGPAAITSGAASAGLGAAGGGALASSAIPGAMGATVPNIASQGASRGIPLGGVTPNSGRGAGNTLVGAGRQALDKLMSVEGMASLAPLIASLASGGMGGSGNTGTDNEFLQQAYGDAKRQNQMQEARYRRVDPLHEAVTQLAFSRLPISSRQGITPQRVPLPE